MNRHQWMKRILIEMQQLHDRARDGAPLLVWLNDLGFTMLGNTDSANGVEWINAVHELQKQRLIEVDQAGYVTLTPRGLSAVARSISMREEPKPRDYKSPAARPAPGVG